MTDKRENVRGWAQGSACAVSWNARIWKTEPVDGPVAGSRELLKNTSR